jgi:hypothetical protein
VHGLGQERGGNVGVGAEGNHLGLARSCPGDYKQQPGVTAYCVCLAVGETIKKDLISGHVRKTMCNGGYRLGSRLTGDLIHLMGS